jgi:hypothetical protein
MCWTCFGDSPPLRKQWRFKFGKMTGSDSLCQTWKAVFAAISGGGELSSGITSASPEVPRRPQVGPGL